MEIATKLSGNDAAVLGALFDPEASLRNHAQIDMHMNGPYNSDTLLKIKARERDALILINKENPSIAETKESISKLNRIIAQYPKYASAWNNRAQARRMLQDADPTVDRTETKRDIFADLAKAIELASPKVATSMVSPENAKVLASAHTHRGFLLWNSSKPDAPSTLLQGVDSLRSLSKDRLEELASRDFAAGGKYGNQTAQQLAVKTNPYAKLCGSIVREALQKEIKDFYEQSSAQPS